MSHFFSRNELDIQCSLQNVRHTLIAKDLILQGIKKRQAITHFANQLDLPSGLKELIIGNGFTSDLLLNMSPTCLSENLGIDNDIAKIIIHAIKRRLDIT